MRIGDAAAAAGTTPRALRFYEQRGLLPAPRRSASGQREYGPADVARVQVIRELLALGLTVRDIRACADALGELAETRPRRCEAAPRPGTAHVVGERIAALDAEIARLTGIRDRLAALMAPTGREAAGWPEPEHPGPERPRAGRPTAARFRPQVGAGGATSG